MTTKGLMTFTTLIGAWLLAATGPIGCAASQALTSQERATYLAALEEMNESDQRYRKALSWGTADPDELARLEALPDEEQILEWGRRHRDGVSLPPELRAEYDQKQIEIDRENTARLMRLVREYGWPTEDRLGSAFPDPTAILIHMPSDRVAGALPILKKEVLAGRMNPKEYAVIYDRKLQHDGKIQLYGMSKAFDVKTRTARPPVITDIDETNQARAEIGLEPLTEYTLAEE